MWPDVKPAVSHEVLESHSTALRTNVYPLVRLSSTIRENLETCIRNLPGIVVMRIVGKYVLGQYAAASRLSRETLSQSQSGNATTVKVW